MENPIEFLEAMLIEVVEKERNARSDGDELRANYLMGMYRGLSVSLDAIKGCQTIESNARADRIDPDAVVKAVLS